MLHIRIHVTALLLEYINNYKVCIASIQIYKIADSGKLYWTPIKVIGRVGQGSTPTKSNYISFKPAGTVIGALILGTAKLHNYIDTNFSTSSYNIAMYVLSLLCKLSQPMAEVLKEV